MLPVAAQKRPTSGQHMAAAAAAAAAAASVAGLDAVAGANCIRPLIAKPSDALELVVVRV